MYSGSRSDHVCEVTGQACWSRIHQGGENRGVLGLHPAGKLDTRAKPLGQGGCSRQGGAASVANNQGRLPRVHGGLEKGLDIEASCMVVDAPHGFCPDPFSGSPFAGSALLGMGPVFMGTEQAREVHPALAVPLSTHCLQALHRGCDPFLLLRARYRLSR